MQQNRQPIGGQQRGSQHPEQRGLHGDPGAVWEGSGKQSPGVPAMQLRAVCYLPLSSAQGVVIGTGEQSQFGEVFKMMQAEEVRATGQWVAAGLYQGCSKPESALLAYRKLEATGNGSMLFVFKFKTRHVCW